MTELSARLRTEARRLRRALWGQPGYHRGWRERLLAPLRVAVLTVEGYRANYLGSQASSLAFFMLLALVPFLAFLFLLLKIFQVPAMVGPYLLNLIAGGSEVLVERISGVISNAQGTGLGGVGILTSFLVGFMVLQRVKRALNLIWGVARRPAFAYRMIEYLAVVTVAPMLLAATFGVSTFLTGVQVQQVLGDWHLVSTLFLHLADWSGYIVLWMLVLYAYIYFPELQVRWHAALIGALVSGTVLKLAQGVYIDVMLRVTNYNMIYGALALLPLLMIWFYVGWAIFLFGAQLSFTVQNYPRLLDARRHAHTRADRSTEPFLAVRLLVGMLHWFEEYGKPAPLRALARNQRLRRHVARELADRLVAAQLVTPVAGAPEAFVPRERMEGVTVRDVLRRMNLMPGFGEPLPDGAEEAVSEKLLAALRAANLALAGPLEEVAVLDLLAVARARPAAEPAPVANTGAEPAGAPHAAEG